MKWINVEDKLPLACVDALTYCKLMHGAYCEVHTFDGAKWVDSHGKLAFGIVTHWMALPPAPKA